jgi:hypothetical protein
MLRGLLAETILSLVKLFLRIPEVALYLPMGLEKLKEEIERINTNRVNRFRVKNVASSLGPVIPFCAH